MDGDRDKMYDGGGYLSRYEFEQAMKRVDGRLNVQDSELTKIRDRLHSIANKVAEIELVKLEVHKIAKAVEDVPRKSDLNSVSQKLDTFLAKRDDGIKMWKVALVGFGFSFFLLIMQIIAKALKLL